MGGGGGDRRRWGSVKCVLWSHTEASFKEAALWLLSSLNVFKLAQSLVVTTLLAKDKRLSINWFYLWLTNLWESFTVAKPSCLPDNPCSFERGWKVLLSYHQGPGHKDTVGYQQNQRAPSLRSSSWMISGPRLCVFLVSWRVLGIWVWIKGCHRKQNKTNQPTNQPTKQTNKQKSMAWICSWKQDLPPDVCRSDFYGAESPEGCMKMCRETHPSPK